SFRFPGPSSRGKAGPSCRRGRGWPRRTSSSGSTSSRFRSWPPARRCTTSSRTTRSRRFCSRGARTALLQAARGVGGAAVGGVVGGARGGAEVGGRGAGAIVEQHLLAVAEGDLDLLRRGRGGDHADVERGMAHHVVELVAVVG